MSKLLDLIAVPRILLRQRDEIKQLRKELERLRTQNESMRQGMRRCVSCDYRLDFKARQSIWVESARSAPSRSIPID